MKLIIAGRLNFISNVSPLVTVDRHYIAITLISKSDSEWNAAKLAIAEFASVKYILNQYGPVLSLMS